MKHDIDWKRGARGACRVCAQPIELIAETNDVDMDIESIQRTKCTGPARVAPRTTTMPGPFLLSTPEQRYYNDVRFKHVVDMLEALIHRAELTPSEIREAAMLAHIHYETRNVRALIARIRSPGDVEVFREGDARKAVDSAYERVAALREYLAKTDPHTGEPLDEGDEPR